MAFFQSLAVSVLELLSSVHMEVCARGMGVHVDGCERGWLQPSSIPSICFHSNCRSCQYCQLFKLMDHGP
jgi:hypothetical protein